MIPRKGEQNRPRGFTHYLGTRRLLGASLVILLLILYGVMGEFLRSRAMNQEIEKLSAQAAALEVGNEEASRRMEAGSSAEALEREARLKLNLRRPGEEVVVVRVADVVDSQEPDSGNVTMSKTGNAVKWWRYFFR